MNYKEISQFIKDEGLKGNYNFVMIFKDGHKEHKRLFYGSIGICEFKKRSRSYGRLFSLPQDVVRIELKKAKEPIEVLRNTLKKAIKYLEKSHLWEDRYKAFTYLYEQSDETLHKFIDNGLKDVFKDKEGFFLSEDEFIGLYEKGIRTIKYDKWDRDFYREKIRKAIQEKSNYHYRWRNGYDNDIEVKLCEDNVLRAWYSEEFVGCANGHYYLALDETHIIHSEDD